MPLRRRRESGAPKAASASRPWPRERGGGQLYDAARRQGECIGDEGELGEGLERQRQWSETLPRRGSRAALRGPEAAQTLRRSPEGPPHACGTLCRCWDSMARLSPLGSGGGEDPKVVRADRDRVACRDGIKRDSWVSRAARLARSVSIYPSIFLSSPAPSAGLIARSGGPQQKERVVFVAIPIHTRSVGFCFPLGLSSSPATLLQPLQR